MKPSKNNAVVDLIDKILTKGVIINADVIVVVAGIPLIGIKLAAALASIETMLDYGMMEDWDESIRKYYPEELARGPTRIIK